MEKIKKTYFSKISVELQVDLFAVRSPGPELEGAGLLVERPVAKVELAEGLEVGRRDPQDVAGALNQEVDVAVRVDAGFFGARNITFHIILPSGTTTVHYLN